MAQYIGTDERDESIELALNILGLSVPQQSSSSSPLTLSDIRKAYKQAALKLHPDRLSNIDNTTKNENQEQIDKKTNTSFLDVQQAYEFLQVNFEPWMNRFQGIGQNFETLLSEIFTNSLSMGGNTSSSQPIIEESASNDDERNNNRNLLEMTVIVTLEDIFDHNGITLVQWTQQYKCELCNGCGARSENCIITCIDCNGIGTLTTGPGISFNCPSCNGRRQMFFPGTACNACGGIGTRLSRETTKRSIDVICNTDQQQYVSLLPQDSLIKIHGLGHYDTRMRAYGDVHILLHYDLGPDVFVKSRLSSFSSVNETYIHIQNIQVSLLEVFCGFNRNLLEGRLVVSYIDKYTDPTKTIDTFINISKTKFLHVSISLKPIFPSLESVTEIHRTILGRLFGKNHQFI